MLTCVILISKLADYLLPFVTIVSIQKNTVTQSNYELEYSRNIDWLQTTDTNEWGHSYEPRESPEH